MSEVEEKFATIIVAQFGVDSASITPATRFLEDLQADGLAVVELIITVEEAFDIEIPDDVAKRLPTVGDLIAYIKSKRT